MHYKEYDKAYSTLKCKDQTVSQLLHITFWFQNYWLNLFLETKYERSKPEMVKWFMKIFKSEAIILFLGITISMSDHLSGHSIDILLYRLC